MPHSLDNNFFKDREDASLQLIESMPINILKDINPVIIGISKGGVFFAHNLAKELECMMDILLSEPIKAPNNLETTIAIISETQEVVMNKALIDSFEISEDFIYTTAQKKYDEAIVSYIYKYRKGDPLVSLEGKDVILVDECVESGLTMMVSLKSVISRGAKNVYIATPILDKAIYNNLLSICDGVFCPHRIEHYISVEYYFDNFNEIEFKEISNMMEFYANKRYNDEIK